MWKFVRVSPLIIISLTSILSYLLLPSSKSWLPFHWFMTSAWIVSWSLFLWHLSVLATWITDDCFLIEVHLCCYCFCFYDLRSYFLCWFRLVGFLNVKKDGTALAGKLIQPLLKLLNDDHSEAIWVGCICSQTFSIAIKLIAENWLFSVIFIFQFDYHMNSYVAINLRSYFLLLLLYIINFGLYSRCWELML